MQAACARAGEVLAGAPLDNGDVDPRQRQLARQHQPCRTSSGDRHRMLGHSHTPAGITPVANRDTSPTTGSTSRAAHTSTTTHAFRYSHFRRFWPQPEILRHDPGLAASPPVRYTLRVERSG